MTDSKASEGCVQKQRNSVWWTCFMHTQRWCKLHCQECLPRFIGPLRSRDFHPWPTQQAVHLCNIGCVWCSFWTLVIDLKVGRVARKQHSILIFEICYVFTGLLVWSPSDCELHKCIHIPVNFLLEKQAIMPQVNNIWCKRNKSLSHSFTLHSWTCYTSAHTVTWGFCKWPIGCPY